MIEVSIFKNLDDEFYAFKMSGHAEFDTHGKDIVCAGASAVVFGAINSILSLTDVEPKIDMDDEGGYLSFEVTDASNSKLQLLLQGMVISLQTIEDEYNDYINLRIL